MSRGGEGVSAISTGDQEAILILLQPKQREQLSEREESFVASLQERVAQGHKVWTLKQEQWFTDIWRRVMGEGGLIT